MTASTRRELRSAATSTSTTAIDLIRALTDARPIKPTSTRCLSARRPNPGRGSTYRRGNSVQTTAATSILGDSAYLVAARHAAHQLIQVNGAWRSGLVCGAANPSLMLGDAGVGYQFLRLHDPQSVPPVLLVLPTDGGRLTSSE